MDMKKDTAKKVNTHIHDDKMPMDSVETDVAQIQSEVYVQPGKTVRYDLYVKDTIVNFTGKSRRAIAINGSIPGPDLVFTEGDTAEIYLHNMLNEETSFHWHGVILPNQADGVPFLTTAPVHPGQTHLYKFKVVQNGTYWYHSHSSLQEQAGMYGALLFKTRGEVQMSETTSTHSSMTMKNKLFDKEYTVVLSEWSDDNPMQIQRRLRTANDWFAIKKGSVQSYAEAINERHFKTKLTNEWKRMKAMDVSDVYYERFLLNGKKETTAPEFKAGERIKLKVVNAGASSYFWLGFAGGKITVVGNDGNDMVPVDVTRLIIAPAETFDVIVSISQNMSYEFRATSEDRTGFSSLWLGSGHKMPAPTLPRLKYFEGMKMMNDMMNMDGSMDDMGMNMSNQKMDMNSVMYPELTGDDASTDTAMDHSQHLNMNEPKKDTSSMNMHMHDMGGMNMSSGVVSLNYDMLRSPVKTALPSGPLKSLHFTLTGNMNRYVWTLDNKTVKESDRIMINKGEVLRIVITNNSMMRHPMHLHGHDFRVVNSQSDYSPLKNVIDIMPMETDTIEFAANQSGNWFFHCHILFHMMAGMGRVFTYNNSPVNPELPDGEKAYQMFRRHKDQNMYHLMVRAGIESNGSDGEAMLSSNRYALQGMWHLGYHDEHGYETEINFGRYLGVNQWWFPYIGFDYHYKMEEGDITKSPEYKNMFGQVSNKNNRKTFVIGVQYTLPWLVVADARIDGDGKLRFQLSREDVPITKRLRLNLMGNTDKEYAVGFRYIISKWFALSTHYDSDMGLGAGITLTY
ncbi:MAG TPA: multicopper oxidase domain-containing protein, partial [Chitinophagaceae bacterium]|nr:multicopper oxidase domain-containing protein [Chitinophagaceae bacterium]